MAHAITDTLKIALAQFNPVVGDLDGNAAKLRKARAEAAAEGADLVVFSELFITGYPPEDLVRKPAFVAAARKTVEALAAETGDGGPGVIVGTIWAEDSKLYNAAALLDGGRVRASASRSTCPNYGVFDEKRVFDEGPMPGPVELPRRAHRRADLRGHLAGGGVRVPAGDRLGAADLAQRLAVRLAQARSAHERGGFARHRNRTAAALREPGRRTGRAGVRRRVLRPRCDRQLAVQLPAWEEALALVEMRRRTAGLALRSGQRAAAGA